jgi:Mrp family chromosome partitioning ATPase
MSRTFEALKRAERSRRNGPPAVTVTDHHAPPVARPGDDGGRTEYERIRAWITNAPEGTVQTVLVTGAHAGSGATTTAARLAIMLASRPGAEVVIVDGNPRRPSLDLVFGVAAPLHGNGIAPGNVAGPARPTGRPNLSVLTATDLARVVPDLGDGLAVDKLLASLKARFRYVVIDAAPLADFPDGHALVRRADCVVLVVEADRTSIDVARHVTRDLEQGGARRIGVVLNRERDYMPQLLRRLVRRSD